MTTTIVLSIFAVVLVVFVALLLRAGAPRVQDLPPAQDLPKAQDLPPVQELEPTQDLPPAPPANENEMPDSPVPFWRERGGCSSDPLIDD